MNPETLYPAIKLMTSQEIFVEAAWIVRGKEILRFKPLKIILKKDKETFARELKNMFGGEEINLSYYSR